MRKVTKWGLFMALTTGGMLRDYRGDLLLDIVNAVEREDGSGQSFNVTGYWGDTCSGEYTIHVRTVD